MPAAQPKEVVSTALISSTIENRVMPTSHFTRLLGRNTIKLSKAELYGYGKKRFSEKLAKDQPRNSSGNANTSGPIYEKFLGGIEYHESFSINQILTALNIDATSRIMLESNQASDLVSMVNEYIDPILEKFGRTTEKQSAELFNTGTITGLVNSPSLNFDRPAGSMVDLTSGGYWSNAAAPIDTHFEAARTYFRKYGRYSGNEFDWTMPAVSFQAFMNTTYMKNEKSVINQIDINLVSPILMGDGSTYRGNITVGSAIHHIYIYDADIVDDSDNVTYFMPTNKVVCTPTRSTLGNVVRFPVDVILSGNTPTKFAAGVVTWDWFDGNAGTMTRHIKMRQCPVLENETMVYTLKVLA